MKEQITKESLNESLDKAKQATEQLKLKIESPDEIKNLVESDINKLKERVEQIQFSLKSFREKIDLLPESTDEKSELAELEYINNQIMNMGQNAETRLNQYFNTSFEYKKEIKPLESKEINKENNLESQEITNTVFEPLEALSKKNKYFDKNSKTVLTPDKYYTNNLKNLDYKNLELAISNPKYQYDIISRISFLLEQFGENPNYIQRNVARELSSILARHKDELMPEKYLPQAEQENALATQENKHSQEDEDDDEEEEVNVYKKEDISEKDLVLSVAMTLISNKEFFKKSSDQKDLKEIILNNTNEKDIMEVFSDDYEFRNSKIQNFISIIESDLDSPAYMALENCANKSFEENNYQDIQKFVICTKLAKEKLNTYLTEKYQVSISEFSNSWNFDKKQSHFSDISKNLKFMEEIEKACPGNVKRLVTDYGIREFCRYPSEILIKQLEEEDINQPYGIIVYPTEDPSDAFDTDSDIFKKLYKDTRGHYGLKIYEVSNKRDFARTLIKNEQKYATENKISFMILGGHGSVDGITIGPQYKKNGNEHTIENVGNEIYMGDLKGVGVKNVSRFFEKDPKIILASCSTGAIGGIGQEISKEYGANVIAPEIPTSLRRIYTSYDKGGKINFDVKFGGRVSKEYQAGKEVK